MTLLDHAGRPISAATLKGDPQTAAAASLRREFADHPSRGLTPAKLAALLEEAEQGDLIAQARLADDMEEKDAHLYAELNKRKRAVLSIGWRVAPPEDATPAEEAAAETIEAALRGLDIETLLLAMADGILRGYAMIELEWAKDGKLWLPAAFHPRPGDWFVSPPEDRNKILLRSDGGGGEELRPLGWIEHRHRALNGYVHRSGLVRVLCWPFLFRNYAARDLAEFLEIYGLPLRLGTYPNGATDDERRTLMRAVTAIGHAAAGIVPEGMRIEFQEAAKGAEGPFTAMMDWAERSMSKAVCGGTLVSGTDDGGAYALGRVHENAFADIVKSDLKEYARTLTMRLVRPIFALGFGGAARPPAFVFDLDEPEDMQLFGEAIPKLAAAGVRIPAAWVRKRLGIPEPEEGEEIVGGAPDETPDDETPDGGTTDAAARTRTRTRTVGAGPRACPSRTTNGRFSGTTGGDTGDDQDAQTDRLGIEAAGPMDAMIGHIEAIVDAAASLEDLRDGIVAAWPDMDAGALAEAMAKAMAAAHLAGRHEILEGL